MKTLFLQHQTWNPQAGAVMPLCYPFQYGGEVLGFKIIRKWKPKLEGPKGTLGSVRRKTSGNTIMRLILEE